MQLWFSCVLESVTMQRIDAIGQKPTFNLVNKTSQNGWHIFSSSNLFAINYFFHEILMKHFCNKIIKRNISWKHTFKRIIMLPQKWFSPHCDQIRDADDENLNCWKDTRAITWLGKIPCMLVFSRKRQITSCPFWLRLDWNPAG